MNAVTQRQDATSPRDEPAETWNRYLRALEEWRQHRSPQYLRTRLDAALAQGRELRRTAELLRKR